MSKNILFAFLIVLSSCAKPPNKSSNVFFAGEIVNPTDTFVVLYKGDQVIDSVQLDANNRFFFSLDSIVDGLYHFNHAPEFQYVYLERGDSLVIRLNTVAFDESLVFSGSGGAVNNFLIDLFLSNEEEEQRMFQTYYKMKPEDFSEKIEELRTQKITDLHHLAQESALSDEALKIANAAIDYTYYGFKEQYPFRHKKAVRAHSMPELPPRFYEYRNSLSYNDRGLAYLRPYYNFMRHHIGNLSYACCVHKCPEAPTAGNKDHLHFNQHKLRLIDSLVKEKELKDNLFRNVAFDYLLKARDKEENNKAFIEEFHQISGNNKHIGEIDELYQGIANLQPQKQLPDVAVTRTDGAHVSIRDIAQDGKIVFYFWSGANRNHLDHITKQVKKLQLKKPHHTFVGINIQTEETTWKKLMRIHSMDTTLQYRAQDFDKLTKSLIVYPMNKCIITEDAQIVDAFSDIYKGL